MPASRKITNAQLEEVVVWMEAHQSQVRGTHLGVAQAKLATDCLWDELTSRLNAMADGVSKTAKGWRQYWSDTKCKVKRKGSAMMMKHGSGTGSVPSWDGFLTPIEERILCLMGIRGNLNDRTDVDMGIEIHVPPPPLSTIALPARSPSPAAAMAPCATNSCHPTPTVATEKPIKLEEQGEPPVNSPTSSQSRPFKRKHDASPGLDTDSQAAESVLNTAAPLCMPRKEQMRRKVQKRRLELERRRLEFEERRLEFEERRLEEERVWRRDMLSVLQDIATALRTPPPPPPEFQ